MFSKQCKNFQIVISIRRSSVTHWWQAKLIPTLNDGNLNLLPPRVEWVWCEVQHGFLWETHKSLVLPGFLIALSFNSALLSDTSASVCQHVGDIPSLHPSLIIRSSFKDASLVQSFLFMKYQVQDLGRLFKNVQCLQSASYRNGNEFLTDITSNKF